MLLKDIQYKCATQQGLMLIQQPGL